MAQKVVPDDLRANFTNDSVVGTDDGKDKMRITIIHFFETPNMDTYSTFA